MCLTISSAQSNVGEVDYGGLLSVLFISYLPECQIDIHEIIYLAYERVSYVKQTKRQTYFYFVYTYKNPIIDSTCTYSNKTFSSFWTIFHLSKILV